MSRKIHRTKEMRKIVPMLERNGFTYARSKGSHFVYINRRTGKHVTINKDLNREVKARLIKENNLMEVD